MLRSFTTPRASPDKRRKYCFQSPVRAGTMEEGLYSYEFPSKCCFCTIPQILNGFVFIIICLKVFFNFLLAFLSLFIGFPPTSLLLLLGLLCPKLFLLPASKFCKIRSSCRGTVETNPTRNHEVAGSIPGLTQWVKDQALQRAVVQVTDTAQI